MPKAFNPGLRLREVNYSADFVEIKRMISELESKFRCGYDVPVDYGMAHLRVRGTNEKEMVNRSRLTIVDCRLSGTPFTVSPPSSPASY